MFHASHILTALVQTPQEIQEIGEWGRKITEVYMNWYTFFVTANLLVMGWFFSKDVKNHKPLLPVSALFLSLNVLGAFSTGLVGWYMSTEVPPHFRGLVGWAAAVTATALLGVGSIWIYLMRTIVKSHKEAVDAR